MLHPYIAHASVSHHYNWRYVALVVVLWRLALSSLASVTTLR